MFKFIYDFKRQIKLSRAEREINLEIYEIVQRINSKYSSLLTDSLGKTDDEKLSGLISVLNSDSDIKFLEEKNFGVLNYALQSGERTPLGGFGVNLLFEKGKLVIYDWNDWAGKYKTIPADSINLKHYRSGFSPEDLRNFISKSSERKKLIEWYADFRLN